MINLRRINVVCRDFACALIVLIDPNSRVAVMKAMREKAYWLCRCACEVVKVALVVKVDMSVEFIYINLGECQFEDQIIHRCL